MGCPCFFVILDHTRSDCEGDGGGGSPGWARCWTAHGLYPELLRELEGIYETITGHLA